MELTDHVYSLPITIDFGDTERTFTPTAVETETGLILFDTTLPGHIDALEDALGEHGFDLDDVRFVVMTHHDGDHAGALATVQEETNAPTFAHWAEAPYLDGRKFPIKSGDERYPPARVDVEVLDGVGFSTLAGPLELVETFGHTPGHSSFHLPEAGVLIAGDALTAADGELHGPAEQHTPEYEQAMKSVAKLGELEFERIVCFHGGGVDAGDERVSEIADVE
ncbi:MBL fold metallo-hydrolase [Halolamina salifodinae]|uniref:Glyoxylase-like metal-dependent hydrolase (Beta-lactamase superfamily II) n=2 Tax=Halolamina salifodinae TaxID=1202767 RepID=A0A8T4GVJ4_9EURY|nr:MBL fold metallo-hydrolase [Halolamina salifodinae]MBP1986450.1 glyoxylase-like metal-dependent hydrolase (beta-lactamase superfamily II) [Halolamina salifodinae]